MFFKSTRRRGKRALEAWDVRLTILFSLLVIFRKRKRWSWKCKWYTFQKPALYTYTLDGWEAHLMMIGNISIFCAKAEQKCIVKIALKGFLFSACVFIKLNLRCRRSNETAIYQLHNARVTPTMVKSTSFHTREREKSRTSLLCRQKSMTTCTLGNCKRKLS